MDVRLPMINEFHTLKNDAQGMMFHALHGIPDPAQECPMGPDTRRRVPRGPAAQSLCFYVASAAIRRYVGPTFSEPLKHLEPTEKRLNTLQESQVKHEATLGNCNRIFLGKEINELKQIDKQNAFQEVINIKGFVEDPHYRARVIQKTKEDGKRFDPEAYLRDAPGMIEFYTQFIQQNEFQNVYEYCFFLKHSQRLKIQIVFLATVFQSTERIKENLKNFVGESSLPELERTQNLATLPLKAFRVPVQNCVQDYALRFFDLEITLWKPEESITKLIQLLRMYGPHACNGVIGKNYYLVDPILQDEKWGDRPVYGWVKAAPKLVNAPTWHCVTVVGAIENPHASGGGYVYWLDPLNPSDPSHPELDRLYKVSYETFKNAVRFHGTVKGDKVYGLGFMWHRKLLQNTKANPPLSSKE